MLLMVVVRREMKSVFVYLTGVLLLGCAVLVSSQPTIQPSVLNTLEGSTVMFSCSFPRLLDLLHLSVRKATPSKPELAEIQLGFVGQSRSLGVLDALYELRVLRVNLVEVEFTFNATRAFNGYTLQCISTNRTSNVDSGSPNVSLIVEYSPSFPTVNERVDMVIPSTPFEFRLNCSEKMGNPVPNVTWTYHNNLSPLITQTGSQNSVLLFQINSFQMVHEFLYRESLTIVCNASNHLGSATKNTTLSLSATPSAPEDVNCLTESCFIKCTWNEPEFSGSSPRINYELVITRYGEEERTLMRTLPPRQTIYSVPKTPSDFYTPNTKFEASIQAVSDVGSSLASSDLFVLPGPCRKPKNLSYERVNQTSVNVSWKAPDCDNLNVPVHTFNVTAVDRNGTRVFRHEVGNQSTSVVIPSLNPDLEYIVTVAGINCYGSTPSATHPIPRQTDGRASTSSSPSTTVYISRQTTKNSTSDIKCKEENGSTSPATVVGIAVSCFAAGCLVGLTATVVVSHKCTKQCKPAVDKQTERVTESSAYALTGFSTGPQDAEVADL